MTKLPAARNENIVVQQLDREVLLYDLTNNQAFCLNETAAVIFNHCDGQTSFADFKKRTKFNDEMIYFTLDELRRIGLIKDEYPSIFSGISRRQAIRQVGLASLVALPTILSIAAPQAMHAASSLLPFGSECTTGAECVNGACRPVGRSSICCANIGEFCSETRHCCEHFVGAECVSNRCCRGFGVRCQNGGDCCSGLACNQAGVCTSF
jgi:hypothetical protein